MMVKEMQLADKQMDHFTQNELERLLAPRSGPCVSIYMPMKRRGLETKGNPIRFKNLLDEAEQRLAQLGRKPAEITELLAPAHARVQDTWFWQHQSAGLAIFAAPGEYFAWRLPLEFEELIEVADHFATRPLSPLLTGDGLFYVLALAKGGVRLLQGVRYTFGEIDLSGVPTSMPEELRYDIFEVSLQHHTAAMEGGGAVGMWHGHGGASDAAAIKQRVKEFCRHLDNGVRERLAGERAPLVLAGVEYLLGFYREVNHYNNLVEQGIDAQPELLRDEELHRRAWAIVEPIFSRQREEALDLYRQRAGSHDGRAGNTVESILPAALYKRVETLFIPQNSLVWGRYNRENDEVTIHDGQWQPGDVSLLDFAAAHTLKNHGTVYIVPPDAIPDRAPIAALFRF